MNLRELELKFQLNLLQQTKLGKCIKKLIYLQSLKLTSLNDTSEAGDLRLFPLFDLKSLQNTFVWNNGEFIHHQPKHFEWSTGGSIQL